MVRPAAVGTQALLGLAAIGAYHSFMDLQFTAVFRKVPEGYIGFVEELPGANAQGATLEEARANLQEAVEMVMQANRELAEAAAGTGEVIREPFKVSAGNAGRWFDTWRNTGANCSEKAATTRSSSTAPPARHPPSPRHSEINDDLAKKICRDLAVPAP